MSDERLNEAVQTTIDSFLKQRQSSNDDIAQDVYRALRDEANLLLEREAIYNVFDSDPFGLVKSDDEADDEDMKEKEKNADIIARCKKLMKVVSCSRTATGDGYSFIQAVVQLNSDDKMQGVNENIRLHFSFLREPQFHDNTVGADSHGLIHEVDSVQCSNGEHKTDSKQDSTVRAKRKRGDSLDDTNNTKKQKQCIDNEMNCNDSTEEYHGNGFIPKTIITYRVDYSVDWGRQQRLFGVDIYAAGEFPSVEEAIPIMDDDNSLSDTDSDGEKNIDANGDENFNGSNDKQSTAGSSEFEDIEMSSNGDQSNEGVLRDDAEAADRFGVFVDPENTLAFLERLNANFNEQSVFHFLLMFPFYEHEWDISGFLLSSLCDDDEDDCDEEMSNEEDLKEGVCIPCPTDNE